MKYLHYPDAIRSRPTAKTYISLIRNRRPSNVIRKYLGLKPETPETYFNSGNSIFKFCLLGISLGFSILNIGLIFYETELLFRQNFIVSDRVSMLRIIILVLCICHAINLLAIHSVYYSHKYTDFRENLIDLFTNKQRFLWLALDVFICMIHTPPYMTAIAVIPELGFEVKLSYSDFIFPFSLFRLKFCFLFFLNLMREKSDKSKFIFRLFRISNSPYFVLKSTIYNRRYLVFIFFSGISVIICGLCQRDFEKDRQDIPIASSFWLAFITETGIGYGEYSPLTMFGRMFSGLIGILGAFIFSYGILSAKEITSLTLREQNLAVSLWFKSKIYKKLSPSAAALILAWWTFKKNERLTTFFVYKEKLKEFKLTKNQLQYFVSFPEHQISKLGDIFELKVNSCMESIGSIDRISGNTTKLLGCCFNNKKRIRVLVNQLDRISKLVNSTKEKSNVQESDSKNASDENTLNMSRSNLYGSILIDISNA